MYFPCLWGLMSTTKAICSCSPKVVRKATALEPPPQSTMRLPAACRSRSAARQRAWLERPRGHAKTLDLGVMATWALFASRRRLSGIGAAGDQDQARLLRDAIGRLLGERPSWVAPDPDVRAAMERRIDRWIAPARPRQGFYVREARLALTHPAVTHDMEETQEFGRRLGRRVLHPFWDVDLVNLLYRTPPRLLIQDGQSKWLLRRRVVDQPERGRRAARLAALVRTLRYAAVLARYWLSDFVLIACAAAATAAYDVLVSIARGHAATLAAARDAALSAIPDGPPKTGGINAGHVAAQAMIINRTGDGRFGAPGFPVPAVPGPGDWRPVLPAFGNDPNAWGRNVRPFMIESASQFLTKGPWALTSPQYAREFNEVKSIGALNSTTRTQYQTDAAVYWGSANPPATWSRIVRGLDTQEGLSTADGARLYAQLYLTAADTFISVWYEKAYWNFWRPITAIREADTDGNPATEKDATWLPLLANPPYPEHPSGHLALSGSFVETLQKFFHRDQMTWTDTAAGITKTYTSFSDALKEIIDVRVWSGIHFRTADEASADLAKDVAKYRKHHFFKKLH